MGWDYYGYKPYVPVAQRRAQAAKEVAKRLKKGQAVSPVRIEGRTIASTFWGQAWCTNLESYSDFANRLPRGRTYVRNGSVVHLTDRQGADQSPRERVGTVQDPDRDRRAAETRLAGVETTIRGQDRHARRTAARQAVESGDGAGDGSGARALPEAERDQDAVQLPGLCAGMCKHIAAVMYGVGNRLDSSPELLFVLRGVDHLELIEQAIPTAPLGTEEQRPHDRDGRSRSHLRHRNRRRTGHESGRIEPREAGGETGCGESPRWEEGRRHESGRHRSPRSRRRNRLRRKPAPRRTPRPRRKRRRSRSRRRYS